jgi:hypothetical protein
MYSSPTSIFTQTSKTTKAASEETAEDKPKRGANPYMLFSQANRASVL